MRKKTEKKIIKNMKRGEKKISEDSGQADNENFTKIVSRLVKNLYYISETDSEIFPFSGDAAESVSREVILQQTGSDSAAPVEERDFTELFGRLTAMQEWFGKDEKKTAKRFEKLKDFLQDNLRDLKIFKIGSVNIDIYIVGLNSSGKLAGVRTNAVET